LPGKPTSATGESTCPAEALAQPPQPAARSAQTIPNQTGNQVRLRTAHLNRRLGGGPDPRRGSAPGTIAQCASNDAVVLILNQVIYNTGVARSRQSKPVTGSVDQTCGLVFWYLSATPL